MKRAPIPATFPKGGSTAGAKRPRRAKARSIRKLCDFSADHWVLRDDNGLRLGLSFISDVVSDACPPLEIAQAKDGTLYLVDTINWSADGVPVCQVTQEEAWRYIARRWLPPVLRAPLAESIREAIAERDGRRCPSSPRAKTPKRKGGIK